MAYYDGTKLLSLKDINGETPEIFICTTNRSGGKTTFFSRMLVNRFLKKGMKFALLYRFKYELDDVADKFFKDIGSLFFPDYIMESENKAMGSYVELKIRKNEENSMPISCGYAITLNSADNIKKYSHLLSDTTSILFDEFQSETNRYCDNEISKFISIHTSLARGQGKQVRYLPVYMVSNQVSIINPYYVELGISSRLDAKTNFMRGEGFVIENGFIESASIAQKSSGFNKAFATNNYVAYSTENIYLNDNLAFVESPADEKPRYIATLRYKGNDYAIKEYKNNGILYCDHRVDKTFPQRISITTDDHRINYVMLKRNDVFLMQLRYLFEKGAFRFKDLSCKECIMKAISY